MYNQSIRCFENLDNLMKKKNLKSRVVLVLGSRYPTLKVLSEQGYIMLARLCKERTLISGVFRPIFSFSRYFGQFLGFGGCFGHFLGLGVFWSFFRYQGYFGQFKVLGLFWSIFKLQSYFSHFLGFKGYFPHF